MLILVISSLCFISRNVFLRFFAKFLIFFSIFGWTIIEIFWEIMLRKFLKKSSLDSKINRIWETLKFCNFFSRTSDFLGHKEKLLSFRHLYLSDYLREMLRKLLVHKFIHAGKTLICQKIYIIFPIFLRTSQVDLVILDWRYPKVHDGDVPSVEPQKVE